MFKNWKVSVWKEPVVDEMEVLFWRLPKRTEEDHVSSLKVAIVWVKL